MPLKTPIDCLGLHSKNLHDKFVDALKLNPNRNHHELAREIILGEHEALNTELNGIRKRLGLKSVDYKKQEAVDIKKIQDEYQAKIDEANTPIPEPEQTKKESQPEKPITEDSGGAKIPPKEPVVEKGEGEGDELRLTHEDTEKIYNEAGLPLRLKTPTKSLDKLQAEADAILKKGYDFNKIADETLSGDYVFEDTDQILFARKVADLKAKQEGLDVNSKDFNKLQEQIEKLSRASDVAGTIGGRFLQSRKHYQSVGETISDQLIIEKEYNKNAPITEEQKTKVQEEFNDIKKAKDDFDAYMAEKEAAFEKKKAESEVDKIKSTSKKSERKDYAAERKQIVDSIREKLKKARQDTSVTVVPYAKELIAIAPDVGKLVKNLVEDGVTKLADVVDNVHSLLKESITDITKKDVVDLIAGEYNEKKPTRNDLAETVFNLKRQAKLTNQLESLLSGEIPVSQERKQKKIKEIEDLKSKIAEIKSYDADANKQKELLLDLAAKRQEELGKKLDKAEKESNGKIEKTDEEKLAIRKVALEKKINEIEEQIKKGDYSKPEPPKKIVLDKEGLALRDKLIKLEQTREQRRLLQQRQNETTQKKGIRLLTEVFNIPRTLMTIGDFSGLLRQNLFFSAGHPLMTKNALPGMFKSFASQQVYDRWFADLKDDPNYATIKQSKLAIADSLSHDLTEREESFMSTLAEKIPIVGQSAKTKSGKTVIPGLNIVKGSERSYTMLLNKVRVDMFNYFAESMKERGMTFENSPKQYKAMAEYINNATGRSDFGKTLNRVAPVLNSVFFSPRLIASRVNMLTYWAQPRFWKTLPREARIDYARNWLSLLFTGAAILALSKMGGADVDDDPRSSDFGKIKSGDTRWDIWGGAQPYIRVLSQVVSGERKSTTSGQIYDLTGDDIFGETRGGVVADFFRGKLAPVPAAAVDLLSGRTTTGDKVVYDWTSDGVKEVSIKDYVAERLLPMTITGTNEAIKDQGWQALATVAIPSIFGVGTQTYGKPVKEVKDEIEYRGDKIKLTTEQHKKYRELANKKIDENVAKLEKIPAYKEIKDQKEKAAIERIVKNRAIQIAEDEVIKMYGDSLEKESPELKKEREEKKKTQKAILKSF